MTKKIKHKIGEPVTYAVPVPMPRFGVELEEPKPRCEWLHHTQEESQGALITETDGFPGWFDQSTEDVRFFYSDHIRGEKEDAMTRIIGCGEVAWCYEIDKLSDNKLRELVKVALGCETLPKHVQCIYNFNVMQGWNIVLFKAIFEKTDEDKKAFADQHGLAA